MLASSADQAAIQPRPASLDVLPFEGEGQPGLVSVIVPTHNSGYVIRRAIDSALAQTDVSVEVIVVDGGSTDDTAAILASYGDRIRYVEQHNTGVTGARNTGLRLARGEFIALLDSDDVWLPWKLQAELAVLRAHPNVGMVWTDMLAIDTAGDIIDQAHLRTMYSIYRKLRIEDVCERARQLGSYLPVFSPDVSARRVYVGDIFSHVFLGNMVHTSTVIMRRERLRAAGLLDETQTCSGEDYEFHLRVSSFGPVAFIDVPTVLYRVPPSGEGTVGDSNTLFIARSDNDTLYKWLERAESRVNLPTWLLRRRLASSHAWLGFEELKAGNRRSALHHLARSLKLYPVQARTAAHLLAAILPSWAVDWGIRLRLWTREVRAHKLAVWLGVNALADLVVCSLASIWW